MRNYFLFLICLWGISSYADEKYFLCGTDEDGCLPDSYAYCVCMPYDDALASQPYCLNLDNVSCRPLSLVSNCESGSIYKDQATCLAVAFQSEPEPPCVLTHKDFCVKQHVLLCDKDGGADSCRPSLLFSVEKISATNSRIS
jgi:hypothetical protein